MGDRAVALIAGEMGELRAELPAPDHGVAAVAGMAEIERALHRRECGARRGRDCRRSRCRRAPAPRSRSLRARRRAARFRRRARGEPSSTNSGRDSRAASAMSRRLLRPPPASRSTSSAPGPARQAVHAARAMAGIVEIIHDGERQAIAVGEPFDGRAGLARDELDERIVRLAMRLRLDVARRKARVESEMPSARWKRVPAAGMRPAESAVEPRGTGSRSTTTTSAPASLAASAAHRPAAPAPTMTTLARSSRNARTGALIVMPTISSRMSAMVAMRATGFSAAIAVAWVTGSKAAQPSSSTIVSMSRTCASRTVEATPPLVTMPPTMSRSTPALRNTHSSLRHVEGGIGDLLDLEVGGRELVDKRMAPGAGREIALAQKRPQRLEMRRDQRLAASSGHKREMGGDDEAAAPTHEVGERLQPGRQRRDVGVRLAASRVGALSRAESRSADRRSAGAVLQWFIAPILSRIALPSASTRARKPGSTTIVASGCSRIAGPSMSAPTGRSSRDQIAVSRRAPSNQTLRVPRRARLEARAWRRRKRS